MNETSSRKNSTEEKQTRHMSQEKKNTYKKKIGTYVFKYSK